MRFIMNHDIHKDKSIYTQLYAPGVHDFLDAKAPCFFFMYNRFSRGLIPVYRESILLCLLLGLASIRFIFSMQNIGHLFWERCTTVYHKAEGFV